MYEIKIKRKEKKQTEKKEFYLFSKEDILKEFNSGEYGLSSLEAEERMATDGPNEFAETKRDSYFLIFIRQFKSPLIYILLISGFIVLLMNEKADTVVIFAVIFFNAIIGALQEGKFVPGVLQVGSKVKIKGSDLIGEVMQISEKWINISVGDIISKVKNDSVEVISNKEFENACKSVSKPLTNNSLEIDERKLNFKTEIDVRGERLNDALDIVARYIDDAELVGASKVRILHGKGTGVLKEEIRKFLKTIPAVQSCTDEDVRFGGSGITIVQMK